MPSEIGGLQSGCATDGKTVFNVLWTPADFECFFPKQSTGSVRCFGLPGEDEVDKLGKGGP